MRALSALSQAADGPRPVVSATTTRTGWAAACGSALLAGLLAGGCLPAPSDSGPKAEAEKPAAKPVPKADDSPKEIAAASLPKAGDLLPPLDAGRLEFAKPADWVVKPRGEHLFVISETDSTPYPAIVGLKPEDEPHAPDTTAENVRELVAAEKTRLGDKKMSEQPRPCRVGNRWGVEHVRFVSAKGVTLRAAVFLTVSHGRRYAFELRNIEADADKHQSALYVLVNSLKFTPPATAPPAEPAKGP